MKKKHFVRKILSDLIKNVTVKLNPKYFPTVKTLLALYIVLSLPKMRIKSLSIKGFKTFYEKSNISFDDNISAIVGPNGCGKTNLLDALRWVLGEQNPRLLRSDSMSQIISDGNDKLSKQGYAEVSLIVENLSSKDDIPNEIEIKKKAKQVRRELILLKW